VVFFDNLLLVWPEDKYSSRKLTMFIIVLFDSHPGAMLPWFASMVGELKFFQPVAKSKI
jgi:hypothetical protein